MSKALIFLKNYRNSYLRLFIILLSYLLLGYSLIFETYTMPKYFIQIVGLYFISEGIKYIIDIHNKILQSKINNLKNGK